ncbi:MAG: BTAD domain-containing putative transcriptional regulator, partial [Anaerolineales bacterium]
MPSLSLNLFGSFDAYLDGHPIPNPGVKSQALLIYLAVDQRPQRREHLLTILWPGMPERSARHNLSQAIYALRQMFPENTEAPLLLADRQTVQLNPAAAILVDLHQFDRLLSTTQTHRHQNLVDCSTCIEALEQVNDLYRGDFISDFYLEDSNEFDEWAEAVREDYRRKWMEALATLSDIAMQVGDYEQALNCINRQLTTDNLSERAHRQKMEMLALAGRRVEAMRQYRELAQLLVEQLGVEPSQETTALYERIRSEDLTAKIPAPEVEPAKTKLPRNNLVPQPTPFIGRQEELAQLDGMLRNPDIRLITIVAPGGMGKTRLAIA